VEETRRVSENSAMRQHTHQHQEERVTGSNETLSNLSTETRSFAPSEEFAGQANATEEMYAHADADREAFWAEQADALHWEQRWDQVLDWSGAPFAKWFVGGKLNVAYNCVDRHVADGHGEQVAFHWEGEPGDSRTITYADLQREVCKAANALASLGVTKGDRIAIQLPMIPEAAISMLACARLGALHSVVFGGFSPGALRSRVQDAEAKLVITSDGQFRRGKPAPMKENIDEALTDTPSVEHVIVVRRTETDVPMTEGRDLWWHDVVEGQSDEHTAEAFDSEHPLFILYTSGTTGKPKGVQRDTGGYAVALASSMRNIFCGNAGETYFATSDIGWVVGHSYVVYGPLLAGMATILYEGTPIRPDGAIWWRIVEKHRVSVMFSAPTAIRVLKKQDPALLKQHDLSSLRLLFLAGEPLDEPTARWIADALGKPIIDNYWQTETGWPILAIARGIEELPSKFGSPGLPCYGYSVKVYDEHTGEEVGPDTKGVVAIEGPLPPGCMSTVWGDDQRFVETYWRSIPGRAVYSTFDWGIRDNDGYFFILGRTDDVINVAGHRLGTREIEEAICSHPSVVEVAVVGVADSLKGQVAMAFAVVRDARSIESPQQRQALEGDVMKQVDSQLGALARPVRVHFVTALPKTRSGKLLRRSVQAICEGRDPGDLTTIEDPGTLEQIRNALATI